MVGEVVDGVEEGFDEVVGGGTTASEDVVEAVEGEHFAGGVEGFGDAIGVENDLVAGL